MTGLIFQYSKNKCKKFGMAFRWLRMRSFSHAIYPANVPYAFFIASFYSDAVGRLPGLNPYAGMRKSFEGLVGVVERELWRQADDHHTSKGDWTVRPP